MDCNSCCQPIGSNTEMCFRCEEWTRTKGRLTDIIISEMRVIELEIDYFNKSKTKTKAGREKIEEKKEYLLALHEELKHS